MIFDDGVTARQSPQIFAVERKERERDLNGVSDVFPGWTHHVPSIPICAEKGTCPPKNFFSLIPAFWPGSWLLRNDSDGLDLDQRAASQAGLHQSGRGRLLHVEVLGANLSQLRGF